MKELLFDMPEQLSPRLAWMKAHCVKTEHTEFTTDDEDEFGNRMFPWYAFIGVLHFGDARDSQCAGGETEDEALVALAIKKGWPDWRQKI